MSINKLYELSVTSIEELTTYCNGIITNNIVSCQKHKWACDRFLRDIKNQGKKKFPYVFDLEKANKFLKWMSYFKHTKGPLEGQNKIPHITEKFEFGNIYGWVHKDTGLRRFRKAYIQKARKNAKSQDQAIVGLYEMSAFGEPCSEVYIAATKRAQTRFVWDEANLIYKRCKELKGKFATRYGEIVYGKTDSKFMRMSKDDKKSGDGSNPQCGILDEYHAHETTEYYDVLSSGMKTRKQPLLMIITTAGFELNHPCYVDEYDYVSKLLNPNIDIENDRYFAIVYELDKDTDGNITDDIKDEKIWIKSNPIIAETDVGIASIKDELSLALDKPEKMRDFLTKTMNVWVNSRVCGYMDTEKWKGCGVNKENPMPDIKGLEVTVGFDLSATLDLTSASFEIPLDDERILVMSHSFMPEATLFVKTKTDKVPYARWAKERWITITPGSEVDYRFMVKYVVDFIAKHELIERELCFDRYMATLLMQELTDEGHKIVDIPQGIPTLGIPTKDFRAKVYNQKIIHNNNPVLSWAIGNAVIRTDHNENIMLDKSKAIQRIDPISALINAHVRVMVKENNVSIYESRGMLLL